MSKGIQKAGWDWPKIVAMSDSDGVDIAARWFDLSADQIEKTCGRFARGKYKGKLRGWIIYRKCNVGGWQFVAGGGSAGVIRPGMIFAQFYRTYEEMAQGQHLSAGQFVCQGKRVDTAYGHDWRAVAEERRLEQMRLAAMADEMNAQRQADLADRAILSWELVYGDMPEYGKAILRKTARGELLTPEETKQWRDMSPVNEEWAAKRESHGN